MLKYRILDTSLVGPHGRHCGFCTVSLEALLAWKQQSSNWLEVTQLHGKLRTRTRQEVP